MRLLAAFLVVSLTLSLMSASAVAGRLQLVYERPGNAGDRDVKEFIKGSGVVADTLYIVLQVVEFPVHISLVVGRDDRPLYDPEILEIDMAYRTRYCTMNQAQKMPGEV